VRRSKRSPVLSCLGGAVVFIGSLMGATGLLEVAGPPAPAGAVAESVTSTYGCTVFGGTVALPISFSGTVPIGVDPGHTAKVTGFQASVNISKTLVGAFIGVLKAKSLSGTVTTLDIAATTATPTSVNVAASKLKFGPITPVTGQPLALSIPNPPVTLGPFKAGSGGTITITTATVKVNAVIRNTSTKTTDISLTCKPKSTPVLGKIPVEKPDVVSGPLKTATLGVPYTAPLPVVGGTAPYTWSITSGTLPPGLTFDAATGTIAGTPTTVGTWTLGVKVVDANGFAATGTVSILVQIAAIPGYQLVASDGGIFSYGGAKFDGSMGGKPLDAPIVGSAFTPNEHGYWEVASDGGIFAFGDAKFYGSMGGKPLDAPIVGIAATPTGGGYWEVASDGGLFNFGAARFYGSMGGKPLNRPIVGIAPTPDGKGYWEVASDGGLFSFGDAAFHGSEGGKTLDAPIVGIAPSLDGGGYYELASDGGIFAFGEAKYYGSMGGKALDAPIVGIAPTSDGLGYWEVASDGGIFSFGDAKFLGSMGGKPLDKPIVGIAGGAYRAVTAA
jgi:hypothetical protein